MTHPLLLLSRLVLCNSPKVSVLSSDPFSTLCFVEALSMSLIITAGHFRRAVHLNRRGPIPFEFDDRCRGDKNWDREKPSDTEGEAG